MPRTIPLICADGPGTKKGTGAPTTPGAIARRGQAWQLALEEDAFRLVDAGGREIAAFSSEEAESAFRLPTGWRDGEEARNVGVVTEGETYWFQPDPEAIRLIDAYLDESLVRQGPEVLDAYRRRARKQFALGLMGLLGGPMAAYYGWMLVGGARHRVPGKLYLLLALVAFGGIAQFARGCRALLRLRRLRALEEQSWWT